MNQAKIQFLLECQEVEVSEKHLWEKMIGKNLMESNKDSDKYIFIEFNAWLYQGYEDAKSAFLVLVYKCGQKKLNNLYYQVKE